MATMELDPLFLKALALLRSKSRDSADQLKALLDEVLGKSGKSGHGSGSFDTKKSEEKGKYSEEKSKGSMSTKRSEDVKKGISKRPLDKPKPDTTNPTPPKTLKLEIPKRASTVRKPVIEEDSDSDPDDQDEDSEDDEPVFIKDKKSDAIEEISSDSDELPSINITKASSDVELVESTTADDFALELGLACVVCKKMDVSARNQLIECQECHNLYHQLCHKPNVVDADPNDPRLVWYCAKCQRNMKKVADKKSKTSSVSSSSPVDASPFDKDDGGSAANFFKRSEPKTPPASSVGKSQPFTGLANLAANLSGKNSSSSKSGMSSSSKHGQSTIIGSAAKNLKTSLSASSVPKQKLSSSSQQPSSQIPKSSGPTAVTTGSSGSSKVSSSNAKVSSSLGKPSSQKPITSSSTKLSSSSFKSGSTSSSSGRVTPVNVAKHKLMSTSGSGSRSPSPQPLLGQQKGKAPGVKNLPQASQASAMKRLQQMKRKASKR